MEVLTRGSTILRKAKCEICSIKSPKYDKKFTCGDPDLYDFICNRASEFQKHFKDKMEFNRFRKKQDFPNEKLAVVRNPQIRLILESVDGGYFSRTSFGFGDVKF